MTSTETALAVLGALLVGGALVSGIARRSFVSLTALFVLAGFALGTGGLGVLEFDPTGGFVSVPTGAPQDANNLGHIFGGVILSLMDKTAAISAFRHSRASVVTASIDRVDFREPIHLGDLVILKASVNFVGRTSMEIGVRVEAEELLTGRRRHTNSCYLTFVAVDLAGRPIEVPGLIPETLDEKRRYDAAKERRARRLEERQREDEQRVHRVAP